MRKINLLFIMVLFAFSTFAHNWIVDDADFLPEEATSALAATDPQIVFITDDDNDNEQIDFLIAQGYDVTKFWPGGLSTVQQDTIDFLNSAGLVIIGRSPGSGTFAEPDRKAWNDLTVPIISNNQYGSRSSRINWFNSTTAFHANEGPSPFNAFVEMPDDPIFSSVTLTAEDSIDLFLPPHDFLSLEGNETNAELVATHDSIVVIARFKAGVEFYPGSVDKPAGPRTYFGFGNDNTTDAAGNKIINYFPLTDNGKAVYLAEVQRSLELPRVRKVDVLFITDDDQDDEQISFLRTQGLNVEKFWPGSLSTVQQDTIDKLNAADLVIIGRSPGSGTFESPDKEYWNNLTVPIISNNQYGSRSSRINWFNSTTAFHANEGPTPFNAFAELPNDPVFSTVTLTAEDSIDLFLPPHDFLSLEGNPTNAELVATHDSIVVMARFAPNVEFYPGSVDKPAGPRTYFGFGNDNTQDDGGNKIYNYFPLTDNGKAVYLAEIQRILEFPITAPKKAEGTIIFVHDPANIDQSNNGTEPRDQPFIDKLRAQGYAVEERYEAGFFALSEAELAEYNEADLVIIGRSGNSGDFQGNNKQAWNRLTSPVMLMSPFAARSSRLDWFNSTSAGSDGLDFALDSVVQAHVEDPADPAFTSVTIPADGNIDWFTGSYRTLYVHDTLQALSNADILVVIENNPVGAPDADALLMARFDAGEVFYTSTEAKGGGPRSYFGLGNDDTTYYNISKKAEAIWLNEVANLIAMDYTPVELPSANSALASLNVGGVLIEGFSPTKTNYTVEVAEGQTPTITATAIDEGATVTVGELTAENQIIVDVVAADGVSTMSYTVDVVTSGATGPNILFVGRAAGGDGDGSDDGILRSKFKEWGYRVTYIEGIDYKEGTTGHDDVDLVYISETIDSKNAVGFATAEYPTPLFLAEPYGVRSEALNLGDLPDRTENLLVTEIQNDDHPITKGVWEVGEDVTVVQTTPSWSFYQYEMNLSPDLTVTNLGKGDGLTKSSWIAIEPSGPLKKRTVILGWHEGVATGGTDDYWTMVERSVLWLLDSLDAGGATSAALDNTFNVYPNPSKEVTSVEYLLEQEGNVTISLLNLSGQLVSTVDSGFKKAGKNISKFNASELSPGLYILRVQGEGLLKSRKIFINQ